jgi:MraZ protein
MFRGYYDHALDEKSRLAIPARYREILQSAAIPGALIVTAAHQCAVAYPLTEWQKIEENLLNLNALDRQVQNFTRYFVALAHECQIDRTGRILLAPAIRERLGIGRDVTIVGQLNKFEIWPRERWTAFMNDAGEQFEQAGASLAQHGIHF